MAELVLSIPVESVETKRKGSLKLFRCSDVTYVVQYKDQYEFINTEIDKVLIEIKNHQVTFHGDSSMQWSFRFINRRHLQIFSDALRECQEICNLTLALSSRLRDVYFSRMIVGGISPEDPSSLCSDELLRLQNHAVEDLIYQNTKSGADSLPYYSMTSRHAVINNALSENFSSSVETDQVPLTPPVGESLITPNLALSSKKTVDIVKCFYCGEKSSDNCQRRYFIHPYVPITFDQKRMIMCSLCIENWHDYRERAESEGVLILPDEINEELCCLCSDTPEELILCSKCQRSYCDGCLQKTVTDRKVYQEIITHADWLCFCCRNRIEVKPLLTKDAWKFCNTGNGATNPYDRKVSSVVSQSSLGGGEQRAYPSRGASKSSVFDKKSRIANTEALNTVKPSVGKNTREENQEMPNGISVEKISPFRVSQPPITNQSGDLSVHKKTIASSSASKARSKGSKGSTAENLVVESVGGSPKHNNIDEVYYFAQYLLNLEESYRQLEDLISNCSKSGKGSKKTLPVTTDEVCFLCKDGGDLIECDFCLKGKHPLRCLKVYHSYCLDFQVEDDVEWLCPRHFCSCCGSKQLKYMCMFCPISVCADCPQNLVETVSILTFYMAFVSYFF
jgi:hypothetical protein